MATGRDLQRRIKSVKNTRQITRAMEMVAAAKMRKAQDSATATRTYSSLAWEMIQNLSDKVDPRIHKLLQKPDSEKPTAIILITSNRGLIGAFNSNIIKTALDYAGKEGEVEFITLGKTGRQAIKKRGFEIAADFEKEDTITSAVEIRPLAQFIIDEFINGKYGKAVLIYMDFVSTLVQKPHIRELLPLSQTKDETLGEVGQEDSEQGKETLDREKSKVLAEYKFEPSPDEVLEVLLPRMAEMQIYQAVLETNASEHSARMVAMKNASESAADLVDDLTLEYNQIRQAAITKEISEIVGGRLALEN